MDRIRVVSCKVLLLVFILLVGIGCAGPRTDDVKAFGETTTKAVTLLKDSASLEGELAMRTATLQNACRYLNGHRYQLAAARTSRPPATITEQLKFLNALAGYADALSKATDPESITKLRAAAAQFSGAAAGFVAAVPGGASLSPVAGPVTKLFVNGVVDFSELQRQRQIRQIAASVNDDLLDGLKLVLDDHEGIRELEFQRIRDWEAAARCNLASVRRHQALATFIDFDKEQRGYLARLHALDGAVKAMGQVVLAHDKIVNSEGDLGAAVHQLNLYLDNLLELKKAITQR